MSGFKKCNMAAGCYILVTIALFIGFGGVLIHSGKVIEQKSYQPTSYVNQIKTDWETQPFIDITVTDNYYCPTGSVEIYTRVWYGQKLACDCLNTRGCYGESYCNKMNYDTSCNRNQTDEGCITVEAFPAIRQA